MKCTQPSIIDLRKVKDMERWAAGAVKGRAIVPCGSCLNCRTRQKAIWANRIILEKFCHGDSVFVTLTYDDDHLPDPPHLQKRDLQLFMKRFRKQYANFRGKEYNNVRFYAVGEYGDKTYRPHFHIILFGVSPNYDFIIKRCWKMAHPDIGIHIGELNNQSASYITGYITKKLLKNENIHPTNYGKPDEFHTMSRQQGGIGSLAIEMIVDKLNRDPHYKKQVLDHLRIGCKNIAIGDYLKNKLNDWQDIAFSEKLVKFAMNQIKMHEDRGKIKYAKYEKRCLI